MWQPSHVHRRTSGLRGFAAMPYMWWILIQKKGYWYVDVWLSSVFLIIFSKLFGYFCLWPKGEGRKGLASPSIKHFHFLLWRCGIFILPPQELCPGSFAQSETNLEDAWRYEAWGAQGSGVLVLEVGTSRFECASMHIFSYTQQQQTPSGGCGSLLSFPRGVSVKLLEQRLTPLHHCRARVSQDCLAFPPALHCSKSNCLKWSCLSLQLKQNTKNKVQIKYQVNK